jgi:hypothetical protein
MAAVFIGTDGSHFSKEIHLERRSRLKAQLEASISGGDDMDYAQTSYSMVQQGILRPLCTKWEASTSEHGCEILPLD